MASTKVEIESRRKEEPQIGRDDDWDDSALIAAYDKAMNKAKVEAARKKNIPYNAPVKNERRSKQKQKWSVGDFCQATFSEDGLCYEAVINEMDESNDSCTVQFIGYGNEEEVPLSTLAPSLGKSQRQKQEEMAKSQEENGDDDAESSSYSEEENVRRNREESNKPTFQDAQPQKEPVPYHRCYANRHAHPYNQMAPMMTCPPPPPLPPSIPTPPPFLMDRAGPEDDKLYSMLLSWYMSGYHTGFYMGSRQAQSPPSHLRNMYNYYSH